MSKEELLTRINAESATLAATKLAFKAELEAKGLTPTDVFASYAPLIESITGGTVTVQDSKTVTFNGVTVEIGPDEGYDGIRKVILSGDPNLRDINIVDAITMYGVMGSAKVAVSDGTEWPFPAPVDPENPQPGEVPGKDKFDDEADEDTDTDDYIVLADDKGNITVGYLSAGEGGLYDYGGVKFHAFPEWDVEAYPHAYAFKNEWGAYYFYAFDAPVVYVSDKEIRTTKLPVRYVSCCENDGGYSLWSDPAPNVESAVRTFYSLPIWLNTPLTDAEGNVIMSASTHTPIGFTIVDYDTASTEFRASEWERIAYHTTGTDAGKITKDVFDNIHSGGWNYLKHLRGCSRERLHYYGVEIWPNLGGNIASWETTFEGDITADYRGTGSFGYTSGMINAPTPGVAFGYGQHGTFYRITFGGKTYICARRSIGLMLDDTIGNRYLKSNEDNVANGIVDPDNGLDFCLFDAVNNWYLYTRNPGTYHIKIEKAVDI